MKGDRYRRENTVRRPLCPAHMCFALILVHAVVIVVQLRTIQDK